MTAPSDPRVRCESRWKRRLLNDLINQLRVEREPTSVTLLDDVRLSLEQNHLDLFSAQDDTTVFFKLVIAIAQ